MRSVWLIVAAASVLTVATPAATAAPAPQFVLSPEGNHLWAYDAATGAAQLVSHAVNGNDPGVAPPPGSEPRDINGQVCVAPDGAHIITGEDTVIGGGDGDSGSSHDPRIAGWGYFAISGAAVGDIRIEQVGKLAPEAGEGEGYAGDPDNYGCGFLDGQRLLTTAIGNTLPGEQANGQLFLWFGPFDAAFRSETSDDVEFFVGEVPHCEIDRGLATAGGIAVADNGDVYVATNRPDDDGNPGGVWRYSARFPSSMDECTPEFLAANVTREQVIPAVPGLPDPLAPTPSSVVISPADTLYVASVFSGTVSEFTRDGAFVRDLWPASPAAPRTGPTGDTPYGLAIADDGSLWIADLGIVVGAPAEGAGSVIRVPFEDGTPRPPGDTIADGLTFPDGLGVYTAVTGGGTTGETGGVGGPGSGSSGAPTTTGDASGSTSTTTSTTGASATSATGASPASGGSLPDSGGGAVLAAIVLLAIAAAIAFRRR